MSEATSRDRGRPGGQAALTRLGDLARLALAAQTSVTKRSIELGRAAVAGDLDAAAAGRAYVDALGREGLAYWTAVGTLGLDYAQDVVTLYGQVATGVLDDAAGAGSLVTRRATAPDGEDGTSPAARRATLVVRGPVGGTATGTLTVANRHPRARRVRLSAAPVTGDGGAVVDVEVGLDPPGATIPAGGEQEVTITVPLPAGQVAAGRRYRTRVDVTGADEAQVDVTVEVLA